MTRFTLGCLMLLIGSSSTKPVIGQDEVRKTFAEFSGESARYLKRLHGKNSENPGFGTLTFRTDYTGGFKAWQRDARKKLVDLLGLPQIEQSVGRPSDCGTDWRADPGGRIPSPARLH